MADFVDSNVLLYSISSNPADSAKKRIAETILDQKDNVLSVQVLQEFYKNATRPKKGNTAISEEDGTRLVRLWLRFRIVETTSALVLRAIDISRNSMIQYWDSAIIAAAEAAGCNRVLTEDLNHGQMIGSVQVINPFVTR